MGLPGGAPERAKWANQRKITKSSPKITKSAKNNKILRFKKTVFGNLREKKNSKNQKEMFFESYASLTSSGTGSFAKAAIY